MADYFQARRRASMRRGNTKVNLVLLVVALIVGVAYVAQSKAPAGLTDAELRAVIVKRTATDAEEILRKTPMSEGISASGQPVNVELSVGEIKLTNDNGAKLPSIVEVAADLPAKDGKPGAGKLTGTYEASTRTLRLKLFYGGDSRDNLHTFATDRD